jgi:tetratricopeptide (TPR) repeat protein
MDDMFTVQDEIAKAILDKLRVKLVSDAAAAVVKHSTESLEAHHAYLEGRYYWNRRIGGSWQKAVACFDRAIALDPFYAQPYAGLADAYMSLAMYGFLSSSEALAKAKPAAERAVTLDETLAEAHAALGLVALWNGISRVERPSSERRSGWIQNSLLHTRRWEGCCVGGAASKKRSPKRRRSMLNPGAFAIGPPFLAPSWSRSQDSCYQTKGRADYTSDKP